MNRLSYIFIGTTFAIIALVSFFIIKPLITTSYNLYRDNVKAKQDLTDVSKEKEILTNLKKDNNLQNVYNIANNYIPETEQSGDLVIEISAIANQSNLKVEQFSIDSPTSSKSSSNDSASSDGTTTKSSSNTTNSTTNSNTNNTDTSKAKEVNFSTKISGTFTDFVNFLKAADKNSRLISFNSIILNQTDVSFTAQLKGKAYWKKTTTNEKTLANINITTQTINKFLGLKTYGSPINLPTESGFGRADPFAKF